jgi:hypothetical protein
MTHQSHRFAIASCKLPHSSEPPMSATSHDHRRFPGSDGWCVRALADGRSRRRRWGHD